MRATAGAARVPTGRSSLRTVPAPAEHGGWSLTRSQCARPLGRLRQRLAETANGSYRADLVRAPASHDRRRHVELATLGWVH